MTIAKIIADRIEGDVVSCDVSTKVSESVGMLA